MKTHFPILLLLMFVFAGGKEGLAQIISFNQVHITGTPENALVILDDSLTVVVPYTYQSGSDSVKIRISKLGYYSLDTIIFLSNRNTEFSFDLTRFKNLYPQPQEAIVKNLDSIKAKYQLFPQNQQPEIDIYKKLDAILEQKSTTYKQTYHSSSTGNLISDLFITTSEAVINIPDRKYKSDKPLFLFDLGFSIIYGNNIPGIAVEFTPFININEGEEDSSVSLAMNAGVGLIGVGGAGSSAGTFSAELSVVNRFNFGFGAKRFTNRKFGFFSGAGIGYSYLQFTQSDYGDYSQDFNNAFGLLTECGIKFYVLDESGEYGMGIKVSYLVNIIGGYGNVIDLTLTISPIK